MNERINMAIGGVGTIGSWALGHWEQFAGIAAGAATAVYMAASAFFLIRDKLKNNDD